MAANNNLNKEENKADNQPQIEKPKGDYGFKSTNYKKLIAAGAVVILVAAGIFAATSRNGGTAEKDPKQGTTISDSSQAGILDDEFEVDAYPKVNELVEEYFKAYAAGDVDAIEKIAYPITETEKSYIQSYSKYVDGYDDIKCYTKHGVAEGEYLVSVECSTKYKGVKTSAPGLEFFYVRTDKNGDAYIDNAYGQFNESYKENKTDVEITRLKTAYDQDEDVLELLEEVQNNYEKALDSDKDLNVMLTDTIQNVIKEWVKDIGITAANNKEDDQEKDTNASERTAYTTTKVNLREKRSISSEVLKTLKKNSKITVSGKSKNGWLKAEYQGKTGYIKEDYITFKSPESEKDSNTKDNQSKDNKTKDNQSKDNNSKDNDSKTDTSKNEEKRTGYAKTKVNMRKSRSTSSKILTTLKAGTKITVYGKSKDKWYKVECQGKTGYIHRDYVVFDKSKVKKTKKAKQNNDSSAPSYFPEGKSITLTQTVNVRTSMSESADLVGLAYQGDVVTVIMSYAEGWTKVSWNDQTGYVKTDVLK